MESFIVRIYRGEKDNPNSFVGIVEEVDTKDKRAFTNLEELWNILSSIKEELPKNPHKDIPQKKNLVLKKAYHPRSEGRSKKEIPFTFIYNKRSLNARTMNISKHGLGVRIDEKISLPVGNIMKLYTQDKTEKAKVIWADDQSYPSITLAGFSLMNGNLNPRGAKKNTHLIMRGR